MPQRSTSIRIPQPCAESWDAMTPTGLGRHCAACQRTVVDFTLKSDAEILAYFQQAGDTIPCGRFRTNQLARPLLPAAPPRPAHRWRGWVAAALAFGGLRAEAAVPLATRPPSTQHPRRKATPATPTRQVARRLVSGVVRDYYSLEPLAHATVKLKGGYRTATTDANGYFRLWLPTRRGPHTQATLVVQQVSYFAELVRVPLAAHPARALHISLVPNVPSDLAETTSGVPMTEVIDVVLPTQQPATQPDTLAAPTQTPRRTAHWFRWLFRS
jgi:hypothetical protein